MKNLKPLLLKFFQYINITLIKSMYVKCLQHIQVYINKSPRIEFASTEIKITIRRTNTSF